MISKAIIPVAGWGTRRLPITKAIEKCMLPIGNWPLVDYVVQDCVKAGITDIYFVVSDWMTQIQAYYSENNQLNDYLISVGKERLVRDVMPPKNVNFHFITQDTNGKYGTAIPVAMVVPELGEDESAVVLMGDDFIYNPDGTSEVARLLQATGVNDSAMIGVNVAAEEVSRYGVIDVNDNNEFVRIVEKPIPEEAPSTLINVSKYVLNADLLKRVVRYCEQDLDGEYMITEPINEYVQEGGVLSVVPTEGQYLDGGSVEGWLHANEVVVKGLS
jgi:UTP--glucose-1-phosphate uridylyltransferase